MSGLSIYNTCIPQMTSCSSSDVDDRAYIQNMTPNSRHCTRRYSSTGASESTKKPSVGFSRSWEFLCGYPKLSVNKGERMIEKYLRLFGSKISNVRTSSSSTHTHSEDHGPDGEDFECNPDVIARSISLETYHTPFVNREHDRNSIRIQSEERPSNIQEKSCHYFKQHPNSDRRIKTGNNTQRNVSQIAKPLELPSSSGNIIHELHGIPDVKNLNENDTNMPSSSKGAIPKCRNILRPYLKRDEDEDSNSTEDGDDPLNAMNVATSEVFPSITNCKEQDLKNMKSLLLYNNLSLGKDVIDNGTTLLNSKLPVHTVKDRLKTFKNWPNKRIEPKSLADAGFFYCGRADIVECYKCGIKGHNWVENDRPMDDHRRWNNDCPFVRENTTEHDNIQVRQGQDICGNLGVEILPNSRPEDVAESETRLEKLGIQKAKGPSHPDQIIYETRLATFENWPKSMKQKPPELAAAGFYYLGVGDQTLCFYCGGGLKDWVEEDNPWEQHALWFPKCNFLLLKKTPAFVEAVHTKHKGLLSSKKEEIEIQASCSSSNNDTKETPNCQSANSEERNSEESTTLCKICFKNELGVVFLPCGHMVACIDCASALKECAVCRQSIQATVRAFLS